MVRLFRGGWQSIHAVSLRHGAGAEHGDNAEAHVRTPPGWVRPTPSTTARCTEKLGLGPQLCDLRKSPID
jgi:hypothetical protein